MASESNSNTTAGLPPLALRTKDSARAQLEQWLLHVYDEQLGEDILLEWYLADLRQPVPSQALTSWIAANVAADEPEAETEAEADVSVAEVPDLLKRRIRSVFAAASAEHNRLRLIRQPDADSIVLERLLAAFGFPRDEDSGQADRTPASSPPITTSTHPPPHIIGPRLTAPNQGQQRQRAIPRAKTEAEDAESTVAAAGSNGSTKVKEEAKGLEEEHSSPATETQHKPLQQEREGEGEATSREETKFHAQPALRSQKPNQEPPAQVKQEGQEEGGLKSQDEPRNKTLQQEEEQRERGQKQQQQQQQQDCLRSRPFATWTWLEYVRHILWP